MRQWGLFVAFDVAFISFLLDEFGDGVGGGFVVGESFGFVLAGRADAAPASGQGVAGLGYFPEFIGGVVGEFEVAGAGSSGRGRGRNGRGSRGRGPSFARSATEGRRRRGSGGLGQLLCWNIEAEADPAWEARDASVGEFLVSEGDGRADCRRIFAFAIAEAGADGEIGAVRQTNEERAHAALV